MAETSKDLNHSILNLTNEEKRIYGALFAQADKEQLGVVTGETAVAFFERTRVSPNVLGEIWQLADTENRGLLTRPGFCIVLRLIGHYQAGRDPAPELAFRPAPMPKFDGVPASAAVPMPGMIPPSSPVNAANFPPGTLSPQTSGTPPIRVPPLDAQKVQQFSALFDRSSAQNGLLDGASAKAIFERAGLSNEILGRIWNLSDREQKGALDQTEFVVAMHLLTSIKSRVMPALPTSLPQALFEAAARRAVPASTRQVSGSSAIPRQLTGNSIGAIPRTQSPLTKTVAFATPPAANAPAAWLVTPADKVKFDQYFSMIDTPGQGTISGEQAVSFFSDSRLPEDVLAQIWDLADINSEGQLNRDEFAVAMYLIRQQRAPNAAPLPAFLPPLLVPPSMRKQPILPPQQQVSTAPVFDNANNSSNLPKSAADDLFGLDEPLPKQNIQISALQPNNTGMSSGPSTVPSSPQRLPPQAQAPGSMFKPFMPTSAFGASLAQQNTGGSAATPQPPVSRGFVSGPTQGNSAADDLLGDDEVNVQESSKLTNETTELANMSNQIGNLRNQMEQTQTKKTAVQTDLNTTSKQKQELEVRLQQFRSQYEQEVRAVKELEQQLTASRESTKRLNQDLAMLEGSYQDLQSQHTSVSQALATDQQENASLKSRIAEINTEVTRLKPEIEKLKLDARQQKGLVSINKKQLATNESERDRLSDEKTQLEREAVERAAAEREIQAQEAAAPATSFAPPFASPSPAVGGTNPFARKLGSDATPDRSQGAFAAPTPSAFDDLFGPSSAFAPSGQAIPGANTPPPTSFVGRTLPPVSIANKEEAEFGQGSSAIGEPTFAATPPASDKSKEIPLSTEASPLPPPPPEGRQFTAAQLPIVSLGHKSHDSEVRSTGVVPPASRAGDFEQSIDATPTNLSADPAVKAAEEDIPGAFPGGPEFAPNETHTGTVNDDFDSAFADFGTGHAATATTSDHQDPFAVPAKNANGGAAGGFSSEFPPIQSLEEEEDDEDDDSDDDDFPAASNVTSPSHTAAVTAVLPEITSVASVQPAEDLPKITSQTSPPTYQESHDPVHGGTGSGPEVPEFDGLLAAREYPADAQDPSADVIGATSDAAYSEAERNGGMQTPIADARPVAPPSRVNTTDVFHDASSRPISAVTDTPVVDFAASSTKPSAFDEFDDFADLAEAKEADHAGANDIDFGFHKDVSDFDSAFDSPAASMTNTMVSAQQTPVAASKALGFAESSSNVPQASSAPQHDWDAIFSGLDSAKPVDTTLSNDPWASAAAGSSKSKPGPLLTSPPMLKSPPQSGGAITPGTEHDDPILKRLTGMGYPRKAALNALEMYDYDINRAVDHLSEN